MTDRLILQANRVAAERERRLWQHREKHSGYAGRFTQRLRALGLLLLFVVPALAQEPTLTPIDRQQQEALAKQLFADGRMQYQAGKPADALKLLIEELKIRQRLHGDDPHPAWANSLNAVGFLLQASVQALPHSRDALAMQQRRLLRELATASEEAAFDKIAAQPLTRDAYFGVALAAGMPATEVFDRIWPSRSLVTSRTHGQLFSLQHRDKKQIVFDFANWDEHLTR
jgi:hypothetical protein